MTMGTYFRYDLGLKKQIALSCKNVDKFRIQQLKYTTIQILDVSYLSLTGRGRVQLLDYVRLDPCKVCHFCVLAEDQKRPNTLECLQ